MPLSDTSRSYPHCPPGQVQPITRSDNSLRSVTLLRCRLLAWEGCGSNCSDDACYEQDQTLANRLGQHDQRGEQEAGCPHDQPNDEETLRKVESTWGPGAVATTISSRPPRR